MTRPCSAVAGWVAPDGDRGSNCMSEAKRQKMSGGSADMVPAGRGLLCISLDSQTVEDALQAMSGACVPAAPLSTPRAMSGVVG
jgi:hypothetical protein